MSLEKPHVCEVCNRLFRSADGLADHARDTHGVAKIGRLKDPPVQVEPLCIECGSLASLVTGKDIYPHRPDLYGKRFYRCTCGAYCGCHPGGTIPLGYPCGPQTRRARSAAHAAFDPLWKLGTMRRHEAYLWLRKRLGLAVTECHIGMMTAEQAGEVVRVVGDLAAVDQEFEI